MRAAGFEPETKLPAPIPVCQASRTAKRVVRRWRRAACVDAGLLGEFGARWNRRSQDQLFGSTERRLERHEEAGLRPSSSVVDIFNKGHGSCPWHRGMIA
jgi:hypothetical protein